MLILFWWFFLALAAGPRAQVPGDSNWCYLHIRSVSVVASSTLPPILGMKPGHNNSLGKTSELLALISLHTGRSWWSEIMQIRKSAIKHANGKSPVSGGFDGKIIYKCTNAWFSIAMFAYQRMSLKKPYAFSTWHRSARILFPMLALCPPKSLMVYGDCRGLRRPSAQTFHSNVPISLDMQCVILSHCIILLYIPSFSIIYICIHISYYLAAYPSISNYIPIENGWTHVKQWNLQTLNSCGAAKGILKGGDPIMCRKYYHIPFYGKPKIISISKHMK